MRKTRRTIISIKGANHEDIGELQAQETYTGRDFEDIRLCLSLSVKNVLLNIFISDKGKADSTIRKRKISYKLFSRFTWFGLKRKIESWIVVSNILIILFLTPTLSGSKSQMLSKNSLFQFSAKSYWLWNYFSLEKWIKNKDNKWTRQK